MPELTIPDRVRLPFSWDPERLRAEIVAMGLAPFTYYAVKALRSPAHLVDPTLPPPPPADDYADGTWTDWKDTAYLRESPYLQQILATFAEHTRVHLVRVLRLAPGAQVKEHTDPTLGLHIERSMVRLTIPVQAGPNMRFYLNDSALEMQPGECWYLRLTDPHRIDNPDDIERINVTIDVLPNAWLREVIAAAATPPTTP